MNRFKKRDNFAQKMIFRFIAVHESAFNKRHVALYLKSLAVTVPEERVDEYRTHMKSNFQKLTSTH